MMTGLRTTNNRLVSCRVMRNMLTPIISGAMRPMIGKRDGLGRVGASGSLTVRALV